MTKYKLEYIWLDGRKPVPELRGKTTLKEFEKSTHACRSAPLGF
jgi:glutamine synthetase